MVNVLPKIKSRIDHLFVQAHCLRSKPWLLNIQGIRWRILDGQLRGAHRIGTRVGGDWDSELRAFEYPFLDRPKHRTIYQRFVEGREWSETDLFQGRYRRRLSETGECLGFATMAELVRHYNKYDRLHERIREAGIHPPSWKNPRLAPLWVHVDRRGHVLWTQNGNHRLAMCVALGLLTIPVFPWVIHEEAPESIDCLTPTPKPQAQPLYSV